MEYDLLLKALAAAHQGIPYATATIIEATAKGTPRKAGAKMVVLDDGTLYGTIGGGAHERSAKAACQKAIQTGSSKIITYDYSGKKADMVCGGSIKVLIEPFGGVRHLIICGGGHIGYALSMIAKMLRYAVTVIDTRKEFANKKRFPHVDSVHAGSYRRALAKATITNNTHIMIATHGHSHDLECLTAVITSNAGYIGLIASKNKKRHFFDALKKAGIPAKTLARVQAPAGIDIGAQTPAEIAISIAAELIALQNQSAIGSEKFTVKGLA